MWMAIGILSAGLLLLMIGAEALVKGASRLALRMGISPLVVGLTVVAFGTSAPEMAVSVKGALVGQADIALGNVVGSNILNILFILGLSAAIKPLAVSQQLIRWDVPLMIGVSVLTYLMALDGHIGRRDGAILFLGIIAYTWWAIRLSRREKAGVKQEYDKEFGAPQSGSKNALWLQVVLMFSGLALLLLGARWLVSSAIQIATYLGVSEVIIGLTIVAAGTSLPEVATSVIASIRGERDIAVGNVVGSNLFNLLAVLGLSSLVSPSGVAVASSIEGFDIPVMIAASVASLPIFFTGHRINRWEGWLFLGYYVAYTFYLILASIQHDTLPLFNLTMLGFVLPVTALTLAIAVYRRGARPAGSAPR